MHMSSLNKVRLYIAGGVFKLADTAASYSPHEQKFGGMV